MNFINRVATINCRSKSIEHIVGSNEFLSKSIKNIVGSDEFGYKFIENIIKHILKCLSICGGGGLTKYDNLFLLMFKTDKKILGHRLKHTLK